MKLIYLFLALSFYSFNTKPKPVKVKLTITNIKTLKGNIEIGIYNDPESFPKKGKHYKTITKKVIGNEMSFFIKDLPKGKYAIALYHDKNSDKVCNLNFLGIPKEPYGFSQNFKPVFSKPSFSDCKINVSKNVSVKIKLIN